MAGISFKNHYPSTGFPVFSYDSKQIKVYHQPDLDSTHDTWKVKKGALLDWRKSLVKDITPKVLKLTKPRLIKCKYRQFLLNAGIFLSTIEVKPNITLFSWGESPGQLNEQCAGFSDLHNVFTGIYDRPDWWIFIKHNHNFKEGWVKVNDSFLQRFLNKTLSADAKLKIIPKNKPEEELNDKGLPINKDLFVKKEPLPNKDLLTEHNSLDYENLLINEHELALHPFQEDLSLGISGNYDGKLNLVFNQSGQSFKGFWLNKKLFNPYQKEFSQECLLILTGKKEQTWYNVQWWSPRSLSTGKGRLKTNWQGASAYIVLKIEDNPQNCPDFIEKPVFPVRLALQENFYNITTGLVSAKITPFLSSPGANNIKIISCLIRYSPVLIKTKQARFWKIRKAPGYVISGYLDSESLFKAQNIAELIKENEQIQLNDSLTGDNDLYQKICLAKLYDN